MVLSETAKKNVITGLIALVISLSVSVTPGLFESDELSTYYICDLTLEISQFDGGISSTGYSGYPFSDSRKGAKRCGTTDNKGIWYKVGDYAKDNGIDPYELIISENKINEVKTPIIKGTKIICSMRDPCENDS